MRFRHIFTYFLMAAFLVPAWGQNTAGSSIASKTLLSSDGARKVEQRVYDNGLGDIVQMITRTVPMIGKYNGKEFDKMHGLNTRIMADHGVSLLYKAAARPLVACYRWDIRKPSASDH